MSKTQTAATKALNTSAQDYRNNKNYIPYHYRDYSGDTSFGLYNILHDNKEAILSRALSNWNTILKSSINSLSSKFGLTLSEKQGLEDFLQGNLLKGFNYQTVQMMPPTTSGDLTDPGYILSQSRKVAQEFTKVEDAVGLLENYLNNSFNQNMMQLGRDYADNAIKEFIQKKSTANFTPTELDVVNAVLGHYNEQFFKNTNLNAATEKLNMAYKRMFILIQTLPVLKANNQLQGSFTVRHKTSNGMVSQSVSGESELSAAIVEKFFGWVQFLMAEAGELSLLQGARYAAQTHIIPVLKKVKVIAEHTGSSKTIGGSSISIDGRVIDNTMQGLIEGLERAANISVRGQAKSDVQWVLNGNGGVTARIGITEKESKKTYIGLNEQGQTVMSGKISLQNKTPLLTLLYREAGLSGSQIIDVIKLASMQDDSGSLNAQWDQLIENLTYRLFLNTLTGQLSSMDSNYFFVTGGQILPIGNFINSVYKGVSSGRGSMMLRQRNSGSKGLERSTYFSKNQWMGPENAVSAYLAAKRSNKQRIEATQILYNTKIEVSLKMSQLVLLT